MKKRNNQTEKKLSLKKLQLMKISNMKVINGGNINGGTIMQGGLNLDGNDDPETTTIFKTASSK